MTSNKEQIEQLEVGLGGLQDSMSRFEIGMTDKMRLIEEDLQRLTDTMLSNCEGSASHTLSRLGANRPYREEENERPETGPQGFYSRFAKLYFPTYAGDDPIEWFNRVYQFFEFQGTADYHKVALASFHLEGEANQW